MSNSSPSRCPRCGSILKGGGVDGLCAKCLGALNFATQTAMPGDTPVPHGPTLTPEQLAPHFPQLEILECLGRGGMGVVYKARQKSLNRLVALKLLAPERADDPQFAGRFAREAQALAALTHPHIVAVYDFGVMDAVAPRNGDAAGNAPIPHAKLFYLLMEFVDGVNLRQAMKAGRFTPEQALAIVPPVCEALQYAHEHGIVHRDIKPENLLLDREGRVKIADFGIAKMLGSGADNAASEEGSQAGILASVAGTPQYMAPEQKAHRATDHRADIYSLGVVLYELLTGELPADKLQPPSRKVQIDVRLDEIVLRALEKSPELRYQTAGEFRTQVETVTVGIPSAEPTASLLQEGMKPGNRAPYVIFLLLCVGLSVVLIASASWLPDRVASHFGAEGRANGWMDRLSYLIFIAAMPPLLALMFAGVARLVRSGPAKFIKIPRRDFWLAAERRAATTILIRDCLAWLLCLLTLFLGGLHGLIVFANQSNPPNLPMGALLLLVMGFLLAVIAWLSVFLMRFAETGDKRGSVPPPNSPAHGKGDAADPRSMPTPPSPRFSRTAIVGACVVAMGLLSVFLSFFVNGIVTRSSAPDGGVFPNHPSSSVGFAMIGAALLYTFFATLLGWIAVSQIRRSEGRIHGLWLAVFDGLLYPLLALDATISAAFALAVHLLRGNTDMGMAPAWLILFVLGLGVLTAALVVWMDFLIIRAVWRTVNKPLHDSTAKPGTISSGGKVAMAACASLAGIGVLLAVWSFVEMKPGNVTYPHQMFISVAAGGDSARLEGIADARARLVFHAGDPSKGWSCDFPVATPFSAKLHITPGGLNCVVTTASGQTLLNKAGAVNFGGSALNEGELALQTGGPPLNRPDGHSTVTIGQWTPTNGVSIPIVVELMKATDELPAFGPLIERVEVGNDNAIIRQRRYDGEGMMIMFGMGTNRWTPGGLYLDAMFDSTIQWHQFGRGADWVIKIRHGLHFSYRLDGPLGPMLGKIVFRPGTPAPESDGSYVIGEFRPEKGAPLPIAVRLEKDSAKTTAPPPSSPAFGPASERTLGDPNETPKDCLISLDSGTLRTLPDSLKGALEAGDPPDKALMAWVSLPDQSVDAAARVTVTDGMAAQFGLRTFLMLTIPIEADLADKLTPDQVRSRLHDKSASWGFIGQINDLMTDGKKTAAYIFQTRSGLHGILQITGLTENPRGVKLRYKLVQGGEAKAAVPAPATDDSISLAQAVNDFNKRYHEEAVTAKQPDLTVEDVLGAIRLAMRDRANLSVTNATFAALGRLAETQVLPKDFELELLTCYEDDQTTRNVWSVRLRIPGTVIPNGTTCISIHEKLLRTHIIGDEERKVIHAWQEKERVRGGIGSFERVEWGRKLREERDAAAALDARRKSAAISVDETAAAGHSVPDEGRTVREHLLKDSTFKLYTVVFVFTIDGDGKPKDFKLLRIFNPQSNNPDAVQVELPQAYIDEARKRAEARVYSPRPKGATPIKRVTCFSFSPRFPALVITDLDRPLGKQP